MLCDLVTNAQPYNVFSLIHSEHRELYSNTQLGLPNDEIEIPSSGS